MADEALPQPLPDPVAPPAPEPVKPFEPLPAIIPSAPPTATERLRAFEDEVIGKDAVRINGRIERGSGSPYKDKLTPEQRRRHGALEHLIETEQQLADAHTAVLQAEADHEAALAAAEPRPDGPAAE